MHPFSIERLAAAHQEDLLRQAAAVRRFTGSTGPRSRDRWEAALTRLTARMYRPTGTPVCCPA
jgi:hypothetical protein